MKGVKKRKFQSDTKYYIQATLAAVQARKSLPRNSLSASANVRDQLSAFLENQQRPGSQEQSMMSSHSARGRSMPPGFS